jgi:hypothetical protein
MKNQKNNNAKCDSYAADKFSITNFLNIIRNISTIVES